MGMPEEEAMGKMVSKLHGFEGFTIHIPVASDQSKVYCTWEQTLEQQPFPVVVGDT